MAQDEESTPEEQPNLEMQVPEVVEHNSHPKQSKFSCTTICAFSRREYSELEAAEGSDSMKKLFGLTIFLSIVMTIEIIGGLKSHSLAVLTDAAHILSDIAGFSISLFTIWVSTWKSTPQQSFGFNRLEVLGALFSVQLIWFISIILIYEAIDRLLHKNANVNGQLMFAVAAFGFLVNCLMIFWLGHDHHGHHCHSHDHSHDAGKGKSERHLHRDLESMNEDDTTHLVGNHCHSRDHEHDASKSEHHHRHDLESVNEDDTTNLVGHHCHSHDHDHEHEHDECKSEHNHRDLKSVNEDDTTHLVDTSGAKTKAKIVNINIQGAYLHIMTDLIQSIGVMIAGSIIWLKPEWLIVDLLCTLTFSVFALSATVPMLRSIFTILMERTPIEIDLIVLENGMKNIKGVDDVHDLHVWAITAGKFVMACHVVINSQVNPNDILIKVREYCAITFGIHHVTAQIELNIC